MNRVFGRSVLALGLILAAAGTASADLPPPNVSQCGTLKPGDACQTDAQQPGTCTASTCSRLDYSAGPPPKSVSFDCITCNATAVATSSSSGSTSNSSISGNGANHKGCAVQGTGAGADGSLVLAVALALPLLRRRRAR